MPAYLVPPEDGGQGWMPLKSMLSLLLTHFHLPVKCGGKWAQRKPPCPTEGATPSAADSALAKGACPPADNTHMHSPLTPLADSVPHPSTHVHTTPPPHTHNTHNTLLAHHILSHAHHTHTHTHRAPVGQAKPPQCHGRGRALTEQPPLCRACPAPRPHTPSSLTAVGG